MDSFHSPCPRGSSFSSHLSFPILTSVLAVLLVLTLAAPSVRAQAVYGSIFGTVTDPTGAVIPNADVTITDLSKNTKFPTKTNGTGGYRVNDLIPDTYSVTVTATGFATATVPSVILYANTAPEIDVKMQTGAASNTVEVTAGAPLLQVDRSDVSTILNSRAVSDLPNINRNFTDFELLTPGTSYIGWSVGPASDPQQSEQIEVNGQLPFATGYELDGTDNQDPVIGVAVINPNLDAVSQMQVISQNYEAEFGKAVGGLVIAETKSGSNSLHGSAFYYRRSDAQQARDPFTQYAPDPHTGKYIPSFNFNQFGGSLGGPIKRDKLFFFGDYQGLREKSGLTVVTTVPTLLAETSCTSGGPCNLSDYLNPALMGGPIYQAYDPETNPNGTTGRTAFPGNLIPAGRLSTPAINLIKLMPPPNNGSNIINNYIASGFGPFNTDQFDVRIDDQVREGKFHLFGRYTRFNSYLEGTPYFGAAGGAGFGAGNFAGTVNSVNQSVAAGGDYVVSPAWLTDFRFGWFRLYLNLQGPNYNQPLGTDLGIPGVNQPPLSLNGGLPQFNINIPNNGSNGGATLTFGTTANQFLETEDQYQGANNWTHVHGNHQIKFGGDFRYATLNVIGLNNNEVRSGNFSFASSTTAGGTSSGLGFASFVLGDVNSMNRTVTENTTAATHQYRVFSYAQDTWRATHRLTINYGVRWELFYPEAVNGTGQGGLLDLNTGDVRIAGYGGYGNNLNVAMEYQHVSPRVGIAFQPSPTAVIRAGYGREYGMGWSGNTFGEVLTFSYPIQVNQNPTACSSFYYTFNLSYPTPANSCNGFTPAAAGPPPYVFAPIPANGNYPLPNNISVPTRPLTMRIPTLDTWNAQFQQQFGPKTSVQIGYVGSHGIHNMWDSSNQASPNQQTLRGFNCSSAPIGCVLPIDPATGLPYTIFERQPYYDGTAQRYLGVNYGFPFGWTQGIRYNANQATTSYQALQVVFHKQYGASFQLQANYTWSHAEAHESDYYFNDAMADYGNSYYNRRNQFNAFGVWDLPFGRHHIFGAGAPGWENAVIGGWELSGNVSAETGLPFTPSYSLCTQDQDIDGQGGSLCRPNWNGASFQLGAGPFNPLTHNVRFFPAFPTLAYAGATEGPYVRPLPGTFGNIFRDQLWGPGYFATDASMAKTIPIHERLSVQFTAQFFNLFNHPNLGQPSSCVDCGTSSGLITDITPTASGSTMRAVQFAGRFTF